MFRFLKHRAEQSGVKADRIDTRFLADIQNIATEIILEAERGGFEAICLGRQGRHSVKEFFIGSVSERLVRHAQWVRGLGGGIEPGLAPVETETGRLIRPVSVFLFLFPAAPCHSCRRTHPIRNLKKLSRSGHCR